MPVNNPRIKKIQETTKGDSRKRIKGQIKKKKKELRLA